MLPWSDRIFWFAMNIVKLARLAWRNLLRNSRRTLITLLVSSAGFAALAIVAGYMEFTFYGLREMTICRGFTAGGGTGHLQVFPAEALSKEERFPLEFGIGGYRELQHEIEKEKQVAATIPRIEFNGLISNGEKSISFLGTGVDPDKELALIGYWNRTNRMSKKHKMDDSAYIRLKQGTPDGVLIGQEMARALNAEVGSSLTLMGTTVDGAVNAVDVTVAGIAKNPLKSIDRYYLVAHLETAQNLMFTDKVSKIVVVLDDTRHTTQSIPSILRRVDATAKAGTFAIVPWDKLAEYYHSVRDAYNIIFGFTGIIVVVIVFLSCANTMLMATMERVREIGTLKAIGISNSWITLMFLLEGFFIGLLSVAGGVVLKYLFSIIINNIGFKMPPPPGMSSSYLLNIFPAIEFMPWIALLVIGSTTFSGFLALVKLKNISIVNSLTHV